MNVTTTRQAAADAGQVWLFTHSAGTANVFLEDATRVLFVLTPGASVSLSAVLAITARTSSGTATLGVAPYSPTGAGSPALTLDAAERAFVQKPPITSSAVAYVATDGSDANDGLTWKTAKATIPAAFGVLGADGGTVELGYGTHAVSSTGRTGTVGLTNGSTTVTDAAAASGDVGAYFIAPNMVDAAQIVSVTPGVSYVLTRPATSTGSVSAVVTQPAVILPNGVRMRGRGGSHTNTLAVQNNILPASTVLQDSGTGVTVMCKHTGINQTANRFEVADLEIKGNSSNIFGLCGQNVWFLTAQSVDFSGHGIAGLSLGHNENSISFRDCRFTRNGTSGSTRVTGGAVLSAFVTEASAALLFENCFFTDNYGWGVVGTTNGTTATGAYGTTFLNCQWNQTHKNGIAASGIGAHVNGDWGNCTLIGCWFESSSVLSLRVDGFASVVAIACMFNAGGGGDLGTNVNCVDVVNTATFNALSCYFWQPTSNVAITVGPGCNVTWQGCTVSSGVALASFNGLTLSWPVAAGGGNLLYPPEPLDGDAGNMLRSGEETLNRPYVYASNLTTASQRLQLTYFTARKTGTYNSIRFDTSGTAAGATPTYCAMGVYRVNADDSLTLIGSSANDTTLFNGTFSAQSRALQASVSLNAGQRYALAFLVVTAAATPTFYGNNNTTIEGTAYQPFICAAVAGQATLPASVAVGSLSGTGASSFYGAIF